LLYLPDYMCRAKIPIAGKNDAVFHLIIFVHSLHV